MNRAILHDEAKAELEEAAAWYEAKRSGLGAEFVSAVENAILRIHENPQWGARYERTRFRFKLVRRFPYVVFYADGKDVLRVIAVAHGKRRPGYWRHRRFR
jgi:toxin ParE1/3/4